MYEVALTTVDNPFDPIEDFENWNRFDCDHQYFTASYLDRVSYTSSQLSDQENEEEIERAIDEILKYNNATGLYKKIKREVSE